MTILYLHGFNSDGEGWKTQALRKHLPAATIISPDLPAQPAAVAALLQELTEGETPDLVIGSSLGGFYALVAGAAFDCPIWLLNPSLRPFETLNPRGIGEFKTWTNQRPYHFKTEYLDELLELHQQIDGKITQERLRFLLAKDDEILDHTGIPHLFPAATVHWFENAGHAFGKWEKVLKTAKQEGWPPLG